MLCISCFTMANCITASAYHFRYVDNVLRKDASFKCTAMAWVPCPAVGMPPALPPPHLLPGLIFHQVDALRVARLKFMTLMTIASSMRIGKDDVRVPLDAPRQHVVSPNWRPVELINLDPASM